MERLRGRFLRIKSQLPGTLEIDSVYQVHYRAVRYALNDLVDLAVSILVDPIIDSHHCRRIGKIKRSHDSVKVSRG